MIYILMTKRDYEEISRGEISSSFRRRDSNNFFEKSFKGNHPNAYRRREEELDRQDKLYEKYRNFRPSRILSGRELQEAIEICSEAPSRCFSFQETLAELGFHSLYSPQARLSSLKVSIERGGAILASGRSTISGGGRKAGGLLSATSDLAVAVGEGVVQLGSDTLHGIGGALSGIQDGVNAYIFDDKSIKESVEIMNKSSADYKDRHGYKLSEKSQEVVNQNPVVKTVNSALENTVGEGVNYAKEHMNETFVFYVGSVLGIGLDLFPTGGRLKPFVKQVAVRKIPQGLTLNQFNELKDLLKKEVDIDSNIAIQGSRAKGTARINSDIDIAILVDKNKFDELINTYFKTPNPGSAKERTMMHAIKTGKIQSGEAKLSGLRRKIERMLGVETDISIILKGGSFDTPPYIFL